MCDVVYDDVSDVVHDVVCDVVHDVVFDVSNTIPRKSIRFQSRKRL